METGLTFKKHHLANLFFSSFLLFLHHHCRRLVLSVCLCVCVHVGVLSVVFISFFARIKKRSLVSVATTSSSSVSSGCKKTTTASLVTVSKRNFSLYFRFPMFFVLSFFQYHIVNNYGNRNQFWEGNISDPWLIE